MWSLTWAVLELGAVGQVGGGAVEESTWPGIQSAGFVSGRLHPSSVLVSDLSSPQLTDEETEAPTACLRS